MADLIYIPLADYNVGDYTTNAIMSSDVIDTNVDLDDDVEYVALIKTTINGQDTYTQPAAGVGWDIDTMYDGGKQGYRFEFDDIGPTGTVFQDTAWTTPADATGQDINSVLDKSPNNNDVSYFSDNNPPTNSSLRQAGSQYYWENRDGNQANGLALQSPFSAATAVTGMSIFVAFRVAVDSDPNILAGGKNGENVAIFSAVNPDSDPHLGFTGAPTYHTNGGAAISSATRGSLYTEWATGDWVIGEAQNFIIPAGMFMHPVFNTDAGAYSLTGDIISVIAIQNPTAADRTGIVAHMQAKIDNTGV